MNSTPMLPRRVAYNKEGARASPSRYRGHQLSMENKVLQLDARDNVLIALNDLRQGERIDFAGVSYVLANNVPAKHKFATRALEPGDQIIMYGVLVGKATQAI